MRSPCPVYGKFVHIHTMDLSWDCLLAAQVFFFLQFATSPASHQFSFWPIACRSPDTSGLYVWDWLLHAKPVLMSVSSPTAHTWWHLEWSSHSDCERWSVASHVQPFRVPPTVALYTALLVGMWMGLLKIRPLKEPKALEAFAILHFTSSMTAQIRKDTHTHYCNPHASTEG